MKVTLEDGRSLELTARRVAGLDATALRQQTADLADLLNGEGGTEPNRDGGTGLESSGRDSNGALEPGGRDRNAAPDPGVRGGGAGPAARHE
ncbi:hypothetical protein E2C11_34400 [Streptomyces lavendulae]|nr:hypothetical protein E2C11_34400 [Streptomyces lavendulae]